MVLNLQMRYVLDGAYPMQVIISDEDNATIYFSHLAKYAQELQTLKKSVIFVGDNFIFGLLGVPECLNLDEVFLLIQMK